MDVYYSNPDYLFVLEDDELDRLGRMDGLEAELLENGSEKSLHKSVSLKLMREDVFGGDKIQLGTIPESSEFDKAKRVSFELSQVDYKAIRRKGAVIVDYELGEIQGQVTIQDGDAAF